MAVASPGELEGSLKGLVHIIREDWAVHGRTWTNPGFHAVFVHRLGRWGLRQPQPFGRVLYVLHLVCYVFVRNFYGIELPVGTKLGRRVKIAHQSGIVISGDAVIHDDCHIRQNVTIGAGGLVNQDTGRRKPILEQGVYVGAGAVIVGGITIGEGATVGANALILTDVPPGATAFARPARITKASEDS